MRTQVTMHRQPQARWSMTSHLEELARRTPADARFLQETARTVPAAAQESLELRAVQVEPPGR